MQFSIVSLRKAVEDNEIFRFDADYFHPRALNVIDRSDGGVFWKLRNAVNNLVFHHLHVVEFFPESSALRTFAFVERNASSCLLFLIVNATVQHRVLGEIISEVCPFHSRVCSRCNNHNSYTP